MMNVFCLSSVSGVTFADQRSVFDAPVFGVAIPAVERLAVEDRLKAGFVLDHRLGFSAPGVREQFAVTVSHTTVALNLSKIAPRIKGHKFAECKSPITNLNKKSSFPFLGHLPLEGPEVEPIYYKYVYYKKPFSSYP